MFNVHWIVPNGWKAGPLCVLMKSFFDSKDNNEDTESKAASWRLCERHCIRSVSLLLNRNPRPCEFDGFGRLSKTKEGLLGKHTLGPFVTSGRPSSGGK